MGLTVLEVLKDYAQYKEVTGLIRGLGVSIGIIEDLVRQQENGEDE